MHKTVLLAAATFSVWRGGGMNKLRDYLCNNFTLNDRFHALLCVTLLQYFFLFTEIFETMHNH